MSHTRTQLFRPRLSRLEDRTVPAAGMFDPTFGVGGRVTTRFPIPSDESGRSTAVDSLGRIVVAGKTFNGSNYDFVVARDTPTGALDTTFGGSGVVTITFGASDEYALSVAVDSLDRVVVAGYTGIASGADFAVARLTAGGALDSSFDGDGRQTFAFGPANDYATGVAVDSLDRVVVSGYTLLSPTYDVAVARLTAGGALDSSFDGDGKQTIAFGPAHDYATGVAVDSLDRVVVVGLTYNGSNADFAVARLTAAGALDNSFDGDGKQIIAFGAFDDAANGVAVDSLDRVVAAGYTNNGSNLDFAVARLTAAGALDASFDGDGRQTIAFGAANDQAFGATVDSLNRVVAAGFTFNGSNDDFAAARLTTVGALDAGFDADGKQTLGLTARSRASANAIAVDSMGRTVVTGYTYNGSNYVFAVARYTPAGALDTTFGATGIVSFAFGAAFDSASGVAVDSLDRVVVSGYTDNGSDNDFAVARLTAAGALDTTFDGDGKLTIAFGASDDAAYGVAVDSLDRVVVAGSTFNGSNSDFAVARLTAVGALDGSFDGDGKLTIAFGASDDAAYGVAVDSLNRVVIGGYTDNGSNIDFAVARLTAAGALDASFNSDGRQTITFGTSDDFALGVAVDSLDRVVAAGNTFTIPDLNRNCAVARLTAAGGLDTSFDGDGRQSIDFGGLDSATSVAVASADRVVLGVYSNYNGEVFALARLTGDTTTAVAQVNDGSAQRSRVTSLTVRFSSQVTFSGQVENAFTLVRTGGGAVTFTANVSVEYGGTVVTLTNLTGPEIEFGSLRDGRSTFTALASQISAGGQALDGDADGTPGGDFVFGDAQGLFRFFGDINGDRHVDIADFGLLSSTFNLSASQTGFLAAFDFNGDGHIDIADFGQFSIRFFMPLP